MGWEGFLGGFGGVFFSLVFRLRAGRFACAFAFIVAVLLLLLFGWFDFCWICWRYWDTLCLQSRAFFLLLLFYCFDFLYDFFFDIGLPYACMLMLSSAALWLLRFLFACLSMLDALFSLRFPFPR